MEVLSFNLYDKKLLFKHPFVIAHGTRSYTDAVFLELKVLDKGRILQGWGEATIPPYLKEDKDIVRKFCESFDWRGCNNQQSLLNILSEIRNFPEFPCGQTMIEMCLLDIFSQSKNQTLRQYLELKSMDENKYCSYTLSLGDSMEDIMMKLSVAPNFKVYKIKFTQENDIKKISSLDFLNGKKFMVDANQAFEDPEKALALIKSMKEMGCLAIEQPLRIDQWSESTWLKERSPIPIIADESFQNQLDLPKVLEAFHGINIKTLKVGGVLPALKIIREVQNKNIIIQVGCMSESSLGCSYALAIVDHAHYIDLDGPLLIKNDPFHGLQFDENGKIFLPERLGIGAKLDDSM